MKKISKIFVWVKLVIGLALAGLLIYFSRELFVWLKSFVRTDYKGPDGKQTTFEKYAPLTSEVADGIARKNVTIYANAVSWISSLYVRTFGK